MIEDGWLRAIAGEPVATGTAGAACGLLGRPRSQPRSSVELLDNFYAAMSLGASDTRQPSGWLASDPFGIHPIYYAECQGVFVASNDSRLVAGVLGSLGEPPRRDVATTSVVSLIGHACGGLTGFEGVRVLPLGHAIRFEASGARLERVWDEPWDVVPQPLDHGRVDAVHERLRAFSGAAVGNAHTRVRCELTGGRDSRLMLALAIDAGVTDDFSLVTFGGESLPDAQTAALIADRLGFPWSAEPWPAGAEFTRSDIVTNASLTGGQLGAGHVRSSGFDGVTLAGFMGETLNSNYPGWRCDTVAEAIDAKRRFCGRLPTYLATEARELAVRRVLRQLSELEARGCAPSSLIDAYYVESRIRRWLGCRPMRWDRHVFPLYSRAGTRAAFAAGRTSRCRNELPLALSDRTDIGLADLEFVKEAPLGHADQKQAFEDALRAKIALDPAARAALVEAMGAEHGTSVASEVPPTQPGPAEASVVPELLGELRRDSVVFEVFDTERMVGDGLRYFELGGREKRALRHACAGIAWLAEVAD